MSSTRAVRMAALGIAALAVAVPFFTATTFIGDDHLFLAYARHAGNPLVAFVSDVHGGEYYRPFPMLVWWLLSRVGGGSVPFALLGLALHLSVAAAVVALVRSLSRPVAVAYTAGMLMLLAPQNLQAAYWFSASTDLFATLFTVLALVALRKGRTAVSTLVLVPALLSKETAVMFPLLAFVVLDEPWRLRLKRTVPSASLAGLLLLVRRLVLGGSGGAAEPPASWPAKIVQIGSGFCRLFTGESVMPSPLALVLGAGILALGIAAAFRRRDARWTPWLLVVAGAAPLGAAPWVVGARYFYLPAVGLSWALAEGLADRTVAATGTVAILLMVLGGGEAALRRRDVLAYEQRVAAARQGVADGVAAGHHVFHVDGGIKDLDLALKEEPPLVAAADHLLVLGDVPASFAIIPAELAQTASFLRAIPPIPPSGAYRFGNARVVGLARRGDEPALDEVIAHFPDIRFLRLRPAPGGSIVARDATDEVKQRLDAAEPDGQN